MKKKVSLIIWVTVISMCFAPDLYPQENALLQGAFYFRADEDAAARVGDHPDVKVRLGQGDDQLIFRRDRGFLPIWSCESGEFGFAEVIARASCNQSINEYSRVFVIESNPARAIVRWRYAIDCSDVNPSAWADEYFTVYPDGKCIRSIRSASGTSLSEWQNMPPDLHHLLLTPQGLQDLPMDDPPDAFLTSGSYSDDGYDSEFGCYTFVSDVSADPTAIELTLNQAGDKQIDNPVIVLKNWGDAKADILVDGEALSTFYTGYSPGMDADHLIVWLGLTSDDPVQISITPDGGSGRFVNRAQPPDMGYEFEDVPPLPMGSPEPGPFGAYYTYLKFNDRFDASWRVGDHTDVVVQFEDNAHRFVFWRGTNYQPHLAGDTGETPYSCWYGTQFVERRGSEWNLPRYLEPMSDWECRFSHVRIISSNNARAIVHWRYAPCHLDYRRNNTQSDPWGDWVNEYYTIYPDAISVRKITAWSRRTGNAAQEEPHIEFHEAIPVTNPGTVPEENIHWNAVSATDYNGNAKNWFVRDQKGGAMRDLDDIENKPIFVVRMKGSTVPLTVVQGRRVVHDPVGQDNCRPFNQYDDWPAWPDNDRGFKNPQGLNWIWDEDPATYCYRNFYQQYPSHCSMFHVKWYDYEHIQNVKRTKIMLFGMVDAEEAADVNRLIPLARSWNFAPDLTVSSDGFSGGAYDKTQRAYMLSRDLQTARELRCTLNASSASPVHNPCLVIKNWDETVRLWVDGEELVSGSDFRQGIETDADGMSSVVVWFRKQTDSALNLTIADEAYTGVSEKQGTLSMRLYQNYPNPFNPSTTIQFEMETRDHVTLEIYDALGRKQITLLDAEQPAGRHNIRWDGVDRAGAPVASGVYLYKLKSGDFVSTRKMLYLK